MVQKKQATEMRIAALRAGLEAEMRQLEQEVAQENLRNTVLAQEQKVMAKQRGADRMLNQKRGNAE